MSRARGSAGVGERKNSEREMSKLLAEEITISVQQLILKVK